MGYGDDMMRAGWAVWNGPVWFEPSSTVYEGHPNIRADAPKMTVRQWEKQHGYAASNTRERMVLRPDFVLYRPVIYLTDDEVKEAVHLTSGLDEFYVIEPYSKPDVYSDNRDWGFHNWQAFADEFDRPLVQLMHGAGPLLEVDAYILTDSYRIAAAVLALASGFIGPDGGLRHAAAAGFVPSVIIWGCHADPAITGYPDHLNIHVDRPEGLGWKKSNPICRRAMDEIGVASVVESSRSYFRVRPKKQFSNSGPTSKQQTSTSATSGAT